MPSLPSILDAPPTHLIPELLSMWEKGKLTSDQAIGHILQTIAARSQRLADTEQRVHRIEQSDPVSASQRPAKRVEKLPQRHEALLSR